MQKPSLLRSRRVEAIFKLADSAVRNPLIAYPAIVALQLRVVWNIWRDRDVTGGDTAHYFALAMNWTHTLHDNIVWSPLYTDFFGTVALFVKNVPAAVLTHRLIIVLSATVLVLVLMRALLGPTLGLLVALWWTVLPPNFNVDYEVHLFAALPVLVAAIVAVRSKGRNGRGVALAVLAGTTLLVRNEFFIATLLLAAAILVNELHERRLGQHVPIKRYVRAYALPLAVVLLLTVGVYSRSSVQGAEARVAFRAKQTLNVCQIYAFTYEQQHPSPSQASPWTDCGALATAAFGRPLPSFLQAVRANPGAMANLVGWNANLLPNGLQVALYGASSRGENPDYIPVKTHQRYALALSLITLLAILAGGALLWRQRGYWREQWLPERVWALGVLGAASVTTLVVALAERPRPEYLYGLTISLMAFVGLCLAAIVRRFGKPRWLSLPAALLALGLIVFADSHYRPGPRPVHDALNRLSVVRKTLQAPRSVLVASGDSSQICAYLAWTPRSECTSPSLTMLKAEVGGRRSLGDVFNEVGVSAIYADAQMHADPALSTLLVHPRASGWRVVATGKAADGPWSVLVPAGSATAADSGGVPVSLTNLPVDLAKPGLSYSGIFKDGWSQRVASIVLAGGSRGRLALRALVLAPEGGKAQRLEIIVDGRPSTAKVVQPGELSVSTPVPTSRTARHIQLRWSSTAAINGHDPRRAAALLEYLGVTTTGAPTVIRFPQAVGTPGEISPGAFPDGWVKQDSELTLAGGPPADLVVRADIPSFSNQHLDIRVNGRLARSTRITKEAFDLRIPVGASSRPRRVQLHWARAAQVAPNDPRRAAARLEFVGVDASPLPEGRPPVVANGSFEKGLGGWAKADTHRLGLTGGITSSARVGSGALQLIEDSSREDDYYSTTVSGLAPNTTYKISASLYVRSFKGGAVVNRGLYGIARASGTYDGSTQTSANITSATSGWVVRTIRIKTGASDNQLELRLYAPRGTTDWDAVTVTDLAR